MHFHPSVFVLLLPLDSVLTNKENYAIQYATDAQLQEPVNIQSSTG